MSEELKKARAILEDGGYTCVLLSGDTVYTDTKRGVAPLVSFLDSGDDFTGFSAADKVVGNGAAYLYVLLGVKELYAKTVSESAADTLKKHGIPLYFDTLVPAIRNRAGDGICPIELAVTDSKDPSDALIRIRERLRSLSKQ